MNPTDILDATKEESPTPRQAEVLEAMETLFLTEGFREVTVEELARRLRCSRRTLYLLASTKEEMFMRVLDRFLARLRRKGWEGAAVAATPDAAVGAYLLPAIEAASRISALMLRDLDAHQPARDIWVVAAQTPSCGAGCSTTFLASTAPHERSPGCAEIRSCPPTRAARARIEVRPM